MTNQDASRAAPLAEAGRYFLLRPDVTFLNHGSFGACPAPVFETYQRWQRELEAEPVEFLGRRIRSLLAEARAPLAAYLGVERDDLVFVSQRYPRREHRRAVAPEALTAGRRGPGEQTTSTARSSARGAF